MLPELLVAFGGLSNSRGGPGPLALPQWRPWIYVHCLYWPIPTIGCKGIDLLGLLWAVRPRQ